MIPAIGYMVGFYILTRMLSVILGKKNGKESSVVIIFAAVTVLVALFAMYILFTQEINLANL